MIHFYLDNNHKNIWVTSPRNGSTLTRAIAAHNNLEKLNYRQLFIYLKNNPDIPINIVFRDPNVRFRSGLFINMYSLNPSIEVNKDSINNYKEYLYSYAKISYKLNNQYPSYHICDFHLDHMLWIPAFFSLYGYNVKLIPISNFTDVLISNFPESKNIILGNNSEFKNRGAESFNCTTSLYDDLWKIYDDSLNKFIFENIKNYKIFYTFNDWTKLETELFKLYEENYSKENIDSILKNAMNLIIHDPYYLMDIYSPKVQCIKEFIFEMQIADPSRSNQIPKLIDIYNNFNNYSDSLKQIILLNK